MPYRTFPLWVTFLGAVTVIAGIVFRVNLRQAADSGPAFLRRLVLAGLMCFWSFGIIPTGTAEEAGRWQQLRTTWTEAEEVVSGQRGDYPFDRAGKERILKALEGLNTTIDSLKAEKVISDVEAELLGLDLAHLTRGVQEKRPTEMEMATCYEPMMFTPELDSMSRLEKRVPLLARLEAGKVSPEVWNKVLANLEKDLAVLGNPDHQARLKTENKKQAAEIATKIREEIDRLGKNLIKVTPEK